MKEAVEHQMEHPQARNVSRFFCARHCAEDEVSAFVTGLRSFFSMDYVQAGLFLTNDRFFDFWKSSNVPALVAQLLRLEDSNNIFQPSAFASASASACLACLH